MKQQDTLLQRALVVTLVVWLVAFCSALPMFRSNPDTRIAETTGVRTAPAGSNGGFQLRPVLYTARDSSIGERPR